MVIDTNIVASTVEEDVRGKQNRRCGIPAMPIEPETAPLSVVVAESASESASRSLQVQSQLQPDKRYFSLFIPVRYGWSGGGRAPLVIPGSKARLRKTDELDELYLQGQSGQLPSSLRLSLLVISIFCIFLICMLTMTPLAGSFSGDTASQQVVMVPKYALDILPRDLLTVVWGGVVRGWTLEWPRLHTTRNWREKMPSNGEFPPNFMSHRFSRRATLIPMRLHPLAR